MPAVKGGGIIMKASDLFVKCLEAEGVGRIFGVPGEENADFMISLLCLQDPYYRWLGETGNG